MDFNAMVFEQIRPILKNLGFLEAEFLKHFGLMRFFSIKEDLKNVVGLSFGLQTFTFNGMHYKIALNAVNEILEKFIDTERNSEFYTVQDYRNRLAWTTEVNKLDKILIASRPNFDNFNSNVVDYLKKFAFPFFDEYNDIKSVNERILNQVPERDYPEWIHGQSTLKILIIMKLCGNPKYEGYKALKENEYLTFVSQNPSMWKPAYDTFLSLVKYLDSEQY